MDPIPRAVAIAFHVFGVGSFILGILSAVNSFQALPCVSIQLFCCLMIYFFGLDQFHNFFYPEYLFLLTQYLFKLVWIMINGNTCNNLYQ